MYSYLGKFYCYLNFSEWHGNFPHAKELFACQLYLFYLFTLLFFAFIRLLLPCHNYGALLLLFNIKCRKWTLCLKIWNSSCLKSFELICRLTG